MKLNIKKFFESNFSYINIFLLNICYMAKYLYICIQDNGI